MIDSSEPNPFNIAHWKAIETPLPEIVGTLRDVLSSRLTTYLAGMTSTETLSLWIGGEIVNIPGCEAEQKLRTAYEITLLLLQFDTPETVRAWFIGMSPALDDLAPAQVIRDGRLEDAMGAARHFIAYG